MEFLEGFICDVTERKKLQSQYMQAQKMEAIGKLAGGLAHDFNNMLHIIAGHAEGLYKSLDPAGREYRHVEQITLTVNKAATLVNQLLAFSRGQKLEKYPIDINELIGTFLPMIRPMLGETISLEFVPGENVGRVCMDPVQIEQVLLNLCINARDAMLEGGRMLIETCQRHYDQSEGKGEAFLSAGDYIVISVSDTGSGIERSIKERMFEPFFTTKDIGQGSGLGLSTAFGIVRQHEGRIEVESEPGYGSCFQIVLPQKAEADEPCQDVPGSSPPDSKRMKARARTILVAEDAQPMRELIAEALEGEGYTVLVAANGREAVHAFEQNASCIDLVLMDMAMPEYDGLEAYKRIATIKPGVTTLFSSGYTDRFQDLPRTSELDIIYKPYTSDILLHKIEEMLQGKSY